MKGVLFTLEERHRLILQFNSDGNQRSKSQLVRLLIDCLDPEIKEDQAVQQMRQLRLWIDESEMRG